MTPDSNCCSSSSPCWAAGSVAREVGLVVGMPGAGGWGGEGGRGGRLEEPGLLASISGVISGSSKEGNNVLRNRPLGPLIGVDLENWDLLGASARASEDLNATRHTVSTDEGHE